MKIITQSDAAPPEECRASDADYRKEIEVDFSDSAVQFGIMTAFIGIGLIAITFFNYLRDLR
jgi:hypothetical protein